jgi:signal transduction histidine kinase
MDVDRFEVHCRPTDLQQLIERVIERATATRDRARVHLDARASVVLSIDELRIERVIANLLGNALKYSPSTSDVIVRLETRHDVARVSVIDAGPGIPPEEVTQLFGKYRRAATSHGHEGSGLGLYVSKRIVEAHGGRIGVDSPHGIGSCFFFELPLAA